MAKRKHNNPLVDLTGKMFGAWTVLKRAPDRYKWRTYWLCRCACGAEHEVSGQTLKNKTSSCCLKCSGIKFGARVTTHGYCKGRKKPPEYHIWNSMKNRCHNENYQGYINYGKRGIDVCSEWRKDFTIFLNDMGQKPFKGASIDRIDNDGNYCKENCRWTTQKKQAGNIRRQPLINGKRICIIDLAKKLNKCRFWVSNKLKEGMNIKDLEKLDAPPYKQY